MNLSQLVEAVYSQTNRPDMVAETLQAVLEATLSVHTIENFYKDIQESVVVFDQSLQYIQTLDTTVIPFYRNMAYIRKTGYILGATNPGESPLNGVNLQTYPPVSLGFMQRVDIGDILDSYGYEKTDVWYQAGSQINLKSSTALQFATIGWYKYPNIDATGVNFSSWIADEMPYVIIYKAAAGIYARIGEDKSYGIYAKSPIPGQGMETGGLYYQQLAQLIRNNILAGE
jgi:hypothetical protein